MPMTVRSSTTSENLLYCRHNGLAVYMLAPTAKSILALPQTAATALKAKMYGHTGRDNGNAIC